MPTYTWNHDRASKRIDARIAELPLLDIEIKDYVKETNLHNLPRHVAYRVDGVHLYADILNVIDMLNVTAVEGETCHRRTLRFLNLHYRAVHRILGRVEAIRVDFHNQRLHSVFPKPYDSEVDRVHRAIATGQLIIDVLGRTGEGADHPAALDHPQHGGLGFAEGSRFLTGLELPPGSAAPGGLVNLDLAAKLLGGVAFRHQLIPYPVEHAPSGLVMDSKLPL